MRLIIEIENEMDLLKIQSLIGGKTDTFLAKVNEKKRTRKDFAKWCRENSTTISSLSSREERNER
ncbi:MAG: hypothetical protein IGQ45_08745 [Cyanobacterium sp. T60_A2020_053]|nr:hypothetical protein [Cyanobacterium sp. T60_A2020_053]